MAGSRFLGGLKNWAFEDESPIQTPSVIVAQGAVQPLASVSSSSAVASFPASSQLRQANPEIKAQLEQAVAEANQLSYTEFTNYLEAMSSALTDSDEATRYRAALAAAAKKRFTSQEIVKGIDAILLVLENEGRRFNDAAAQRISERVSSRESELAEIERQISENGSKIAELQAQNVQLSSRKRVANEEIVIERQKVEDKKREFVATIAVVSTRYQEERQRVLAYAGKGA